MIGLLWPWLAGVKLAPSAPIEEPEVVEAPPPKKPKKKAAAVAAAAKAKAAKKPKPEPDERIDIEEAQVTSCRNGKGERQNECQNVEFDKLAEPRLKALGSCEATEGAEGVLSIGFDLDFEKNAITDYLQGKSTTLPDPVAQKLVQCAKEEFKSASLKGVEHKHARYTVFYLVRLLPPGQVAEGEEGEAPSEADDITEASGSATVSWEVALIRKEPKEGDIVARILSGTRVVVTGKKGDWYRVKYDGKGNEGWVYRGAIGM